VKLSTTNALHSRASYPEYFGAVTIEPNSPHGEESQNQLNQSKKPQKTEHYEDERRFARSVIGSKVRVISFAAIARLPPLVSSKMSLLLAGLLGGFSDLSGSGFLLGDGFDDTNGNRLPHVTDGEAAQRRIFGERLHAHGLGWGHFDDGGITVLDAFGEGFQFFAGTTIALLEDLVKFAGDVGGVAIHDWRISVLDFTRMIENDDLGIEVLALFGGVVLGVGSDVATTDFLDGHVLDVEANVVTRKSLRERLVVHLHRFYFSGDVGGSEGYDHTRLDNSSLNTADGHCSNATNFVDILEGKTERLVSGPLGWDNGIKSINKSEAS